MEILLCPIGILDVNTSTHAEILAVIMDETGGKLEGCPGARALTDTFVIQKLCHDTHEQRYGEYYPVTITIAMTLFHGC